MCDGLNIPSADDAIPGLKYGSLYVEVYVPHEAAAGAHKGKLTLQAGGRDVDARRFLASLELHLAG